MGKAMAHGYAAEGAHVVIADLNLDGAEAVAAEIREAGGAAVADGHDVSTPDGGHALVDAAVERFGRVDIVVNNAGIIRWAGFPNADAENLERHLAVHVGGSFHVTRAAWPHLVAQGYGRVVMTTSSGVFGLPLNLSYATAKGGVIGMARSLATAGAEHGIRVNCIAPAATTRMAGPGGEEAGPDDPMAPERVAPMAAYLCHEDCPVTGEVYVAGAGRFARMFLATTPGVVLGGGDGRPPTVEDVAANFSAIADEAGYAVPRDLEDWSATFLSHLS
jgi:NAD(P)-dependent dehydrogenase (short-subunit alcohol dehydrogenase family)